MQLATTRHAELRMRQRGIRHGQISTLVNLVDIDIPVGRSLNALRMSRQALAAARADGLSNQEIDLLSRIALVESSDGALVTVAHMHGSKSRVYRRHIRRKFWR